MASDSSPSVPRRKPVNNTAGLQVVAIKKPPVRASILQSVRDDIVYQWLRRGQSILTIANTLSRRSHRKISVYEVETVIREELKPRPTGPTHMERAA